MLFNQRRLFLIRSALGYLLRPRPAPDRVISLDLQRRVTHALSWILNPLSHSESVERYRAEIDEAAWDAVLEKYRIDAVLWVKAHGELRRFLIDKRGWKEEYAGLYETIYVKP